MIRVLIVNSGAITGVVTATNEADALAQAGVGETALLAPDDTPYIDDALLEIADGVIVKKSGVPGTVPGDGLEVAVIE